GDLDGGAEHWIRHSDQYRQVYRDRTTEEWPSDSPLAWHQREACDRRSTESDCASPREWIAHSRRGGWEPGRDDWSPCRRPGCDDRGRAVDPGRRHPRRGQWTGC